jgi:TfoX/Sxy family transcriptional regulator of competence genes
MYDEKLAERIRKALARRKGLTEKRMFGGVAFMLGGHMCCGVHKNELILRLEPEEAEKALKIPGVRVFDITGRPSKGFVLVSSGGYRTDAALAKWVRQAVDFAASLPAK